MLSVKSIISKIIKELGIRQPTFSIALSTLFLTAAFPGFSQDNSPYSRYGLGDIVPSTNINSRGMGGISAGYGVGFSDVFSINFNNPASYGSFQTLKEPTAKRIARGRAILDIGINLENRSLREPNSTEKFSSPNALFSYVQVGVPIKPNWGLSFGLRPVTRISYKMENRELLKDPNSGLPIDSAVTLSEGDGGSYLASLGLGHKINLGGGSSLSLGANGGYFFGQQDYATRRTIFNDSISYNSGNYQTKTSYGNLYFNAGLQFQAMLKRNLALTIGAQGNWEQKLNASQDVIRETYFFDESSGYIRLDSVWEQRNVKGTIVYPSSYTIGFTIEKYYSQKEAGWLFGVDYVQSKWSEYRYYGQADPSVRDKWEVRAGIQLRPALKANYFSNVAYRLGAFFGPDYINVNQKLPVAGGSFGLGLPIRNFSRQNEQWTIVNLAFEYIKRGNNDNVLKENLFRLSAGFSLSDLWFNKRKYD